MNNNFKIDWKNRIIYLNDTINNSQLVMLFNCICEENIQQMIDDGPTAEWKILTIKENN